MDLLEPILDENRMCVEYRHVSAFVPATVSAGGLFSGWNLPKLTAKAKAKEKAKLRRVSPTVQFICVVGQWKWCSAITA